ncbi:MULTISPECIES: hypothetical protein [Croceibacter]|jgi:hypothetical protein|uniref:Uncharacterized protein n=1 Tax=Croceibacter atlanticus (strain ATCC BAA-628 / JCM 21780 / CIP 108009 / IAM 15332 / KCTC 12090 / HTCC2559) TaxID=216432 RepID=A3U6B1_CROAH|nr:MULTISPECIES: hypothetical protein [Croceibacter]EAP87778.1 hypothetical protein CA2559_03445 [Croceibacter atlanticus HTCC2559]MBG25301.1 hypothetical protein [Croceibacter sp.]MBW4969991.1 hypothetical protein [Croceibacter atlanticus]WSP35445.1 hypothetical protein VVL01_05085 [Croceibacter atlanticus]|tara:strand:+ start:3168 stop:3548 length:381 start_codon:yes stop_codon:yes gene_type:complete
MIPIDKNESTVFLKESVEYLEERGFENIKADVEGYESPKSYIRKGRGQETTITPDIVAERNGEEYIYEVSLKSEKPRLLKSKWKFLQLLSNMKNKKFKIITTRGHYKFTNTMLSDLDMQKNLIKIN